LSFWLGVEEKKERKLLNSFNITLTRKMTSENATVFECPDRYKGWSPSVFLAGGITGCPDWQAEAKANIIAKCPGLVILNPRRSSFDVKNENMHDEQIEWEHASLHQAKAILFWFPKETLCPITLYELGTWSALSKYTGTKIFVGCDLGYTRRKDVETQLRLAIGPDFVVHSNLDRLLGAVQTWWSRTIE
jgi:hypothetical protein